MQTRNCNIFYVFVVLLFLWKISAGSELEYKRNQREGRFNIAGAAVEEG